MWSRGSDEAVFTGVLSLRGTVDVVVFVRDEGQTDFAAFKDLLYPLQEPCRRKAQAVHDGCFGLESRIHYFQS